jgi:signal transduction histidine kinase
MLDITERRAAERALTARDRRWQLVAQQAPIVVYTVDRNLRFTSGVGAGMTALGLRSNGTLVGVSLEEYFQASGAAQPLIDAHRKALGGDTVRTESHWLGRTHELLLEPLRNSGESIIGVVGVAVDITEEKEHQRQRDRLLEAERAAHAAAEGAVRLRDQFLSVASHELRTPLASLMLVLQAMLRPAREDRGAADMVRRLELAVRQIQRLGALLDQLLEASRIGAGQRLDLEAEEVDLAAVVGQVVDRLEPELAATSTALEVISPAPVIGWWDRSRMDQLITNLLSNAIKYGAGRPVKISVEAIGADRAFLSVRDQGIGIAKEDLPQIFQPFKRLHDSRHYGGFGLGLFIVAEIVRAHHGDIQVQSEPDRGAEFTVQLPVRPLSPSPVSSAAG